MVRIIEGLKAAAISAALAIAARAQQDEESRESIYRGKAQVANLIGDENHYHTIGGEASSGRKGYFASLKSTAPSDWFAGFSKRREEQKYFIEEADDDDPLDPSDDILYQLNARVGSKSRVYGARLSSPIIWDGLAVHAGYWKKAESLFAFEEEIDWYGGELIDIDRETETMDAEMQRFDFDVSKAFRVGDGSLDLLAGVSCTKGKKRSLEYEYFESGGFVVENAYLDKDRFNGIKFTAGGAVDIAKGMHIVLQGSSETLDKKRVNEVQALLQFKLLGLYIAPAGTFRNDYADARLRIAYLPSGNGKALRNYDWQAAKNTRIPEGPRKFADEVNALQRDCDAGTFLMFEPSAARSSETDLTYDGGASLSYSQRIGESVRVKAGLYGGMRVTELEDERFKDRIYKADAQLDIGFGKRGGLMLEGAAEVTDGDSGKQKTFILGVVGRY